MYGLRRLLPLVGLFLLPALATVKAQGPRFFFCFASNPATGTIYVSDMHPVGPVSERAKYGQDFASFLVSKKKVPIGTQGYCVMRGTEKEVEKSALTVAENCDVCGSATKMEPVAWSRGGHAGIQVAKATNNYIPPSDAKKPVAIQAGSKEGPVTPGIGAFLLTRIDALDAVFSANRDDSYFAIQHAAAIKGGKWSKALFHDKCVGWVAVSYATDGKEWTYFVSRGAASEGEARISARKKADEFAAHRNGWIVGMLNAFENKYTSSPVSLDKWAKDITQKMREWTVDACADVITPKKVPVNWVTGVRG